MLNKLGRFVLRSFSRRSVAVFAMVALIAVSAILPISSLETSAFNVQASEVSDMNESDVSSGTEEDSTQAVITLVSAEKNQSNIFPVYITVGNETKKTYLSSCTVSEAIDKCGIKLGKYDSVNYELSQVINDTVYIDIVRIDYVYETCTEPVAYSVRAVRSSSVEKGEVKVARAGVEGQKQVTYLKTMVNGVETERSALSEQVTVEPVSELRHIGTAESDTLVPSEWISKIAPSEEIELDENGCPVNYTKCIVGKATAYCSGTTTATGVKVKPGYVAVNPKMIPYGTKLFIKSSDGNYTYGYAIAADTGGFVNTSSTLVDLYFTSYRDCVNFGRRNVEIYVLP